VYPVLLGALVYLWQTEKHINQHIFKKLCKLKQLKCYQTDVKFGYIQGVVLIGRGLGTLEGIRAMKNVRKVHFAWGSHHH
jgi:hypothetical protein